jgi:hypothetical protein
MIGRGPRAERERDRLVEETVSAWRPRTPDGGILPHPAWADLPQSDRERAFDETLRARFLEAALDPGGLSGTARAVLGRIAGRLRG